MEDKELARLIEEISEEIERAKQRIMWKIACQRGRHEAGKDIDRQPAGKCERSFFSLD